MLSTISAGEAGPSSTGLVVSLVIADGEEVHDAALDVTDVEVADGGDVAVPHCACAFCITLLDSSRNIKDSWSRYPGHFLPIRIHCEHSGFTLSHLIRR